MAQRDQQGTLRDKFNRVIRCEKDFLTKKLRHDDGSFGHYRAGKLVVREDSSSKPKATGAASAPAEKEPVSRVKKPLDVNARALTI
jgi:hypothetical protein